MRSAGVDLTPRLTGELATVGGTYRAYGQLLSIEQGVLRFAGPYNNPYLDILAIRPNLQQRVGVQIRERHARLWPGSMPSPTCPMPKNFRG